MRRREFITFLGGAIIEWPLSARAQQSRKMYVIGLLSSGVEFTCSELRAVLIGALQELGWAEGKNIVFESRCAEDRLDRLSGLVAELVRLNVDVIVTRGTPAALVVKQATASIPIVMTTTGDPVGTGLVSSLARPVGNITGLSLMSPEVGGKRLEMLREVLPHMSHAAVLWNSANPYAAIVFRNTANAARSVGIELQSLEV